MTANDERWLELQIERWERTRKRADTILEHLYGLRDALADEADTTNNTSKDDSQSNVLTTEEATEHTSDNTNEQTTESTNADTTENTNAETTEIANADTTQSANLETTGSTNVETSGTKTERTKKPLARDTIVALLRRHGALTVPSLDERLAARGQKITREGITKALKGLEEQGLVVREKSVEPGTSFQFRLVTKGEQPKRHEEAS